MIDMTIEDTVEKLERKKYLTVEDEEAYMQEVYDSIIGEIENFMFLTPNWISQHETRRNNLAKTL